MQTFYNDPKNQPIPKYTNLMLPRRQEILNIVTDHPLCTFDFVRRRFASIPVSTLHNDLQYLQKQKLISKHGISRGSVYSATNNS